MGAAPCIFATFDHLSCRAFRLRGTVNWRRMEQEMNVNRPTWQKPERLNRELLQVKRGLVSLSHRTCRRTWTKAIGLFVSLSLSTTRECSKTGSSDTRPAGHRRSPRSCRRSLSCRRRSVKGLSLPCRFWREWLTGYATRTTRGMRLRVRPRAYNDSPWKLPTRVSQTLYYRNDCSRVIGAPCSWWSSQTTWKTALRPVAPACLSKPSSPPSTPPLSPTDRFAYPSESSTSPQMPARAGAWKYSKCQLCRIFRCPRIQLQADPVCVVGMHSSCQ